jgi:tetratricopeptide (TPR) repeat protein
VWVEVDIQRRHAHASARHPTVRGTNLSAQVPEKNLFVEDVVTALTGPVDASGNSTTALRDQMRRATDEFDQRTAEAFARSLLDALCADEIDVRRLEALLILGLAHPTILQRHRISLRTEGKRLATMLEHQGQAERARILMETIEQNAPEESFVVEAEASPLKPAPIDPSKAKAPAKGKSVGAELANPEEQVAEYLRRADKCAESGRTNEAIRWLQEVVALDRNRRDVVRMIRDLRWGENERKAKNSKRFKLALLGLVLCGMAYGVYWREGHIGEQYRAIPQASQEVSSLRERLDAIDALLASNYVWAGMGPVLREQQRLHRQIAAVEAKAAEAKHLAAVAAAQKSEEAQAALSRGMLLAQQGHFEEALIDLRHALEIADPSWPDRKQVEANVVAIEAWLKKTP